ncbi:MAG TPA: hypothetical protein VN943_06590 [Candidatus Acidoferrum sp.]|nr:hypothetical protein [Candidatus Acidoferrum sp.]
MPNKQHLVTSIAAVARRLGRAPSLLEFVTGARIPKNSIFRLFPRWNDAVRAAGLQPHRLYLRPEDHELLADWGETVRKLRAVPSRRAYDLNGKHYPITLEKRFGGWPALPQAFRDFAKGKREWADVLALVPDPAVGARDTPPALSQQTAAPHTIVGARDTRARLTNERSVSTILPRQLQHAALQERRTYGEPMDFPTLRHEPVNEQGVVLLFGMIAKDLGYVVESVQAGFPDCEVKRQIAPKRWQRVNLEFEFESRNFRDHGHPLTGCDVIVCWHHNWPACPAHIEVLELSTLIKSLRRSQD